MTRALPAAVLTTCRRSIAIAIVIVGSATTPIGCGGGDPIAAERAAEEEARARADAAKAPPPASTEEPENGQPRARSALGKARERAERLEGEVAEYQKKLEKAADGEFE